MSKNNLIKNVKLFVVKIRQIAASEIHYLDSTKRLVMMRDNKVWNY